MTLLKKMILSKKTIIDEVKDQAGKMTSMKYFKLINGGELDYDSYIQWYNVLSDAEKKRINAVIDSAPVKSTYISRFLLSDHLADKEILSGNVTKLPIKNLVSLRYVVENSEIGEMAFRATGFIVCTDAKSKEQEFPTNVDVVLIRSNGEMYKYKGVRVLKQGKNRYYLNFDGYTSYELDKTLLSKYCKGDYGFGKRLRDLPKTEFVSLKHIIERDHNINIHIMHDYESTFFKQAKRKGVDAQV